MKVNLGNMSAKGAASVEPPKKDPAFEEAVAIATAALEGTSVGVNAANIASRVVRALRRAGKL